MGDRWRVFSRAGEDTTARFSEVGAAVRAACSPHVQSLIVEGEVVAVDGSTGAILPFQALTARHRCVLGRGLCSFCAVGLCRPCAFHLVSKRSPKMVVLGVVEAASVWALVVTRHAASSPRG